MTITARMQKDIIAAMKAHDKEKTSALRMILSELQKAAKEEQTELSEQQEQKVLATEKKKRLQAAEAFRQGGAEAQAEKEDSEADLIGAYLPQALSEEELEALVDAAINESGAAAPGDMGKVMGVLMPRVAGRADGKTLSEIVKRRLT